MTLFCFLSGITGIYGNYPPSLDVHPAQKERDFDSAQRKFGKKRATFAKERKSLQSQEKPEAKVRIEEIQYLDGIAKRGLHAILVLRNLSKKQLEKLRLEGKEQPSLPHPFSSEKKKPLPPGYSAFEPWRLRVLQKELQGQRKQIEAEVQRLQGIESASKKRLAQLREQFLLAQGRTEAVLSKEFKDLEDLEASLKKRPEDEEKPWLLEALSLNRKQLEKERLLKAEYRKLLQKAIQSSESYLKDLEEKRLKPIQETLLKTQEALDRVGEKLLPPPPSFSQLRPSVKKSRRIALEKVFLHSRQRVAEAIDTIVGLRKQQLRLQGDKKTLEAFLTKDQALVEEARKKTDEAVQESPEVLYFTIFKYKKRIKDHLQKALEDPRWSTLPARIGKLKAQLTEAAREETLVEPRLRSEAQDAWGDSSKPIPAVIAKALELWGELEIEKVRKKVLETERLLFLTFEPLHLLEKQRAVLEKGLKELHQRSLLLRDPDRLSLSKLGRGIRRVLRDGIQVLEKLFTVPLEIWGFAALEISVSHRVFYWLLPLLGMLLSLLFFRYAKKILCRFDGDQDIPRREDYILALFGMLRFTAFPIGIGAAFLLFSQEASVLPGKRALAAALGHFLVWGSLWWASSKVALRPTRWRLRLLPLDDRKAKACWRYSTSAFFFWVLGWTGELAPLLIGELEGQALLGPLTALAEGGLLMVFFLFLSRKDLVLSIFPVAESGGLAFLRRFVQFLVWPARFVLALALFSWIFQYFGLASLLGLSVLGVFGAVSAGVLIHRFFREEIRFRFLKKDLSAPGFKLFGDYLQIVEILITFLGGLTVFSLIVGMDLGDWSYWLDRTLWGGNGDPRGAVHLKDLLLFILFLYLTIAIARRMRITVDALLKGNAAIDRGLRYTLGTVATYVVFVLGLLFSFDWIRVGLSQLQWTLAALGVGIGFGLQDIVSNFFSGLILLFERPLRVGDIVKVGETLGEVKKITIRSTTVTSFDNIDVIVPNKDFISQPITNWTGTDRDMRSTINIGVAYGTDLKKARELLVETVKGHGRVYKKPEPAVFATNFGDSSIDFAVVYWTDLGFKRGTFSDLHFAIYAAFNRAGIEIPFPQRDVHLIQETEAAESESLSPSPEPQTMTSIEEKEPEVEGDGGNGGEEGPN
jgi:small-conductance mechanosensitive channel